MKRLFFIVFILLIATLLSGYRSGRYRSDRVSFGTIDTSKTALNADSLGHRVATGYIINGHDTIGVLYGDSLVFIRGQFTRIKTIRDTTRHADIDSLWNTYAKMSQIDPATVDSLWFIDNAGNFFGSGLLNSKVAGAPPAGTYGLLLGDGETELIDNDSRIWIFDAGRDSGNFGMRESLYVSEYIRTPRVNAETCSAAVFKGISTAISRRAIVDSLNNASDTMLTKWYFNNSVRLGDTVPDTIFIPNATRLFFLSENKNWPFTIYQNGAWTELLCNYGIRLVAGGNKLVWSSEGILYPNNNVGVGDTLFSIGDMSKRFRFWGWRYSWSDATQADSGSIDDNGTYSVVKTDNPLYFTNLLTGIDSIRSSITQDTIVNTIFTANAFITITFIENFGVAISPPWITNGVDDTIFVNVSAAPAANISYKWILEKP